LPSAREHQAAQALGLARQLTTEFPDNSRFQADYAKLCFDQGQWEAAEATCQTILAKNSQGYVGYKARAGRTAAYMLGYLQQHRYHNPVKAQHYYRRCLVFSETIQLTTGYYVFATAALGNLAAQQPDVATACRYYALTIAKAGKREPQYQEARAYLRRHGSPRSLL
jgi:tetratricopeptide (TPR) repeat protein